MPETRNPKPETERKPLCIFHKNCLDGRGSAAVVAKRYPNCEFIAMQYGMPRPTVTGRAVFVVDFGLGLDDMRALYADAASLSWLDHHASQLPVRNALGWGVVDTEECGTSLVWKTLFPDVVAPPVVEYIKDKDLWRWLLPDSRAIAAGLEASFTDLDFAGLLTADLGRMCEVGRPIIERQTRAVAAAAASGIALADALAVPGLRALAVRTRKHINEIGELICLPTSAGGLGYDLAVVYYQKREGTWVHSLRSADAARADCAALAVPRGGGGHPTSASYLAQTPIVPVEVRQKEV